MDVPGFSSGRQGHSGLPNPNMWQQRNIAGTQDLLNQEGDGVYPYGFFFQPPGVPTSPNPMITWSGLPPSGGFIPYTPFMLPSTYFVFPSFPTNQGIAGGLGASGGASGVSALYDSDGNTVTVDLVSQLDFTEWTSGLVREDPQGSGILKISPPSGSGSTGELTILQKDTQGNGPIFIPSNSGNDFAGNITIGFNYDTVDSFNSATFDLRLKSVTTQVVTEGTNELVSGVTTDAYGRFTAYKKITVDSTTSFESTLPASNQLQLKAISYSTALAAITDTNSTRLQTNISVDGKGRVTSSTTRDIGLFQVTKRTRVNGEVHWTYELRRLFDTDSNNAAITTFPFTANSGAVFTAYNGLEASNTTGYVYGDATEGLPVLSASGTGAISLDGSYAGFFYGPVPQGTIVLAFKEGNVNPKWWFTAPNTIYGSCPQ